MSPSISELLDLHVRALFLHDADDRITIINEPNGVRAPRCFCARAVADTTTLVRLRYDVPAADPPPLSLLRADGPAYAFPAELAAHAAEAGVTTHSDHRGRNHAAAVVSDFSLPDA